MKNKIFLMLALIQTGCVSVTSLSVSDFENANNTTPIEIEDYYVDVFHLTAPFVNLNAKLKEQCTSGNITGVQTTLTMREFLVVQFYTAEAKGYCKK